MTASITIFYFFYHICKRLVYPQNKEINYKREGKENNYFTTFYVHIYHACNYCPRDPAFERIVF